MQRFSQKHYVGHHPQTFVMEGGPSETFPLVGLKVSCMTLNVNRIFY